MPDGRGHQILTRAAIACLPDLERELLSPVKDKLENEYCMHGDSYFTHQAEIGPYVELPDGRLPMDPWEIRFFKKDAPGVDWYICGYYDLMRTSFEYFAGKCVDSLRSGRVDDYARYLGSIAHVIEDCGCPSHAVGTTMGTDMKMIKLLRPSSNTEKMAQQFHSVLEGKYQPFSIDYEPRLLGASPAEISFHLLERFTDMLEVSIAQIIPMVDAFYEDDEETLSAHLTLSGKKTSETLADFVHATLCAANANPGDSEPVWLSELTPYRRSAWAPSNYPYIEIRKAPWCLKKGHVPIPLALFFDGEKRSYGKGFGLGVPFKMSYVLPKGVYKKFDARVGLHGELGGERGVIFIVIGDGEELAKARCETVNDSKTITADISDIDNLSLRVASTDPETPWPNNTHAVWGNPMLSPHANV